MRFIMPHVGHWRSFQVERAPKKIVRLIFDQLRDVSAPRLEILKVFGERLPHPPFRPLSPLKLKLAPFVHGEAPSLKELVIEGVPYDYFVNRFRTLQVLRLAHPDFITAGAVENVKSIHHILVSLLSLRTLQIDSARRIYSSQGPLDLPNASRQISHPSLTELSIYLPQNNEDMVLGSLTLPKLRYFLTTPVQAEATLSLGLLATLSEYRPFPNLISLCIGTRFPGRGLARPPSDPVKLVHLEGALAGLPQLKALTFDHVEFGGNKWLACLATTCPRLHWLSFNECGGCTLEPLRAVVERRRTRLGFDPLVKLVIQQRPGGEGMAIDEGTDRWLKQSLIYEVTNPAHPYERDDYLRVVEGVGLSVD